MKKRILSVLLAALLISPAALVSCSKDDDTQKDNDNQTGNDTTTVEIADTTSGETKRADVKDSVPDDLKFNGETIRLLMRGDHEDTVGDRTARYEIVGTDGEGDTVSEAVYKRNRTVEERLNVTMEVASVAGGWLEVGNTVKATCMAATAEYDYLNTTGNTTSRNGVHPYLRDLSNMPYADYDEVWWWSDAIEAISIDNNHVNFIYGDSLIYCYIQSGVFYYNKTLYDNIYGNADEVYQFVTDGTWTMDKLIELTEGAYADLNGNGIEDEGDQFGALKTGSMGDEGEHFVQGLAVDKSYRDSDGNLVIDLDEERCAFAFEKLQKFWFDTKGVYGTGDGIDGTKSVTSFSEGNIVFYPGRMSLVLSSQFRNMEDPYGILPYPKLDETQDGYYSLIHNSATSICVPKSVSDERFEIVGAWLECLTAESWRSVMPEFLEVAMKAKYSQDSQSSKVIDIVVASVTKNTLLEYTMYTNDLVWGSIINPARKASERISDNFASAYASLAPNAQAIWDKNADTLRGD